MSDELDDVLNEFIIESYENLDSLDRDLVTLEQESTPDILASVFRAIHTIKGTAGFFGFETLESIAHVGENLLSRLRDGELEVTQAIVSALLSMVDAIREVLESIERDAVEHDVDYSELIDRLGRLERGEDVDESTPQPPRRSRPMSRSRRQPSRPRRTCRSPTRCRRRSGWPTTMPWRPRRQMRRPRRRSRPTRPSRRPPLSRRRAPPVAETAPAAEQASPTAAHAGTESIRVDVGLLDDLMNLVGELVLARNQILQYTGTQTDSTFNATTQRLNLITTELQEGVMRTRMQPIENVWNKFPRVVRDLSVACNKQANLVMEGRHTELDKTLLEAIKDPLTHLVRNAVDHGLEGPRGPGGGRASPPREPSGCAPTTRVGRSSSRSPTTATASTPTSCARKAVEKGVLTKEEAAARGDRDIVNIIFSPGFSTAEAVTNISGRGVGMDVVRTNIESIGGSIDVQSKLGHGTTFKVKIPLTLAIIPALVVTCDNDRFAIPQVSLLELVRVDPNDPQSTIEFVHGAPVYRLRGRLLPIVYLHEVFGKEAPSSSDGVNIIVLQADDREFGLVVDDISDTAEIVVKPLGRILKQVSAFAGATIMGDGRVALILDVLGIAEHLGMMLDRDGKSSVSSDDAMAAGAEARRMLILGLGDRRLALPLEMVARLEEFESHQVETTATGSVVQYRGEIMHLVDLAGQLGLRHDRPDDRPMQVVVYNSGDRSVGVVVDAIYDVVEEVLEIQDGTAARGMLGSAVIQGRVTDVLDVESVLQTAIPALFRSEAA